MVQRVDESKSSLQLLSGPINLNKDQEKHRIMGNIYRTHINSFHNVLKKLKITNFDQYIAITREQLEEILDLRKIGVKLKTTNVVELD